VQALVLLIKVLVTFQNNGQAVLKVGYMILFRIYM